jgi:hypothetical protein
LAQDAIMSQDERFNSVAVVANRWPPRLGAWRDDSCRTPVTSACLAYQGQPRIKLTPRGSLTASGLAEHQAVANEDQASKPSARSGCAQHTLCSAHCQGLQLQHRMREPAKPHCDAGRRRASDTWSVEPAALLPKPAHLTITIRHNTRAACKQLHQAAPKFRIGNCQLHNTTKTSINQDVKHCRRA